MKRDAGLSATPPPASKVEAPAPVTSSTAGTELADISIPQEVDEQAMECTEVYLSKDALMAEARDDLKELMRENLGEMTDEAVDKTFVGLATSLSKIEARQSQHARQIFEAQHVVAGQSQDHCARSVHRSAHRRTLIDLASTHHAIHWCVIKWSRTRPRQWPAAA